MQQQIMSQGIPEETAAVNDTAAMFRAICRSPVCAASLHQKVHLAPTMFTRRFLLYLYIDFPSANLTVGESVY